MLQARRSRVRFPIRLLNSFSLGNPSSRTMALGSTQPLTEMSTSNLPGGKGRPARKADKLTAICELIVWKMWEPRRLTALLASAACYRANFTLFYSNRLHVIICLLVVCGIFHDAVSISEWYNMERICKKADVA
jgi:hypothetical protein